jgi:hypothetical protein
VRYPQGAEDITTSLTWLVANVSKYGGNPSAIFPIGQSAGGAHLATALFTGHLDVVLPNLGGIILMSVPFWYDLRQDRRRANMQLYHDSENLEYILSKTSVSAYSRCTKEDVDKWPPILTTVGEYDPNEIVEGNLEWLNEYRRIVKRMPLWEVLEGQNHISYALSIGVEGEEVGERILRFVAGHVKS